MGLSMLTVLAIVVLAVIVFRRGPDRAVLSNRQASWLLYAALILTGVYAGFWLLFSIRTVILGGLSVLTRLLPGLLPVVLVLLAWRRPMEGGIVLIVLGLLGGLYISVATMQGGRGFQVMSLVGGAPYVVLGLLFLAAAALARRR